MLTGGKKMTERICGNCIEFDGLTCDRTGWKGITFEVASSGVFGAMDSLNVTPFWDVLLYLYKCKYEYLHNKNKTSNLHGKR